MRFMRHVVVAVGLLGCGSSALDSHPPDEVGQGTLGIVGGIEAWPYSWPWLVSLQSIGYHFCGGSLLRVGSQPRTDIVLTAAHCVADDRIPEFRVVAGVHDVRGPGARQATTRVAKIVYHPDYDPETSENDIAVLKLETPVEFGIGTSTSCGRTSIPHRSSWSSRPPVRGWPVAQPVCLPSPGQQVPVGELASIAGWGLTKEDDYDTSSILMQVKVPIVSDEALVAAYAQERIPIAPALMFGAGYPEGGKDSCQGDSGGPLVLAEPDGAYVLHGLTSFGLGCGRPGLPGVYTRVSHYLPWIHARIQELSGVQSEPHLPE